MTDETTAPLREDTMLYREPTADSDENAIQDIWGQRLEVRTVDVSEVADLLEQGWVQHPLDLGKKPEERAGFEKVAGKELEQTRLALDTAEKLVGELTAERDALRPVQAMTEASEAATRSAADLKAAEELADAETKAKEAALAELATLKASNASKAKPDAKG
jgi:hypothetical protein